MRILLTGAAGFIGSQLSEALLASGAFVIGVDSLNAYYDPALKRKRLERLLAHPRFEFHQLDLSEPGALDRLKDPVDRVVHLAAQAGVRYSIDQPFAYSKSNLTGHLTVLEYCRAAAKPPPLIYASSSSVYGEGAPTPFREDGPLGRPVSLYAATKRADELMSETYAGLYGLEQIGVRLFTVYGPWGRPDMAYWLFSEKILEGAPIKVFNGGALSRDFTYVDDVVAGLKSLVDDPATAFIGQPTPHRIYNMGSGRPVPLMDFINIIERLAGKKALTTLLPMQAGDVSKTWADVSALRTDYKYTPSIPLEDGLSTFMDWFQDYRAHPKHAANENNL